MRRVASGFGLTAGPLVAGDFFPRLLADGLGLSPNACHLALAFRAGRLGVADGGQRLAAALFGVVGAGLGLICLAAGGYGLGVGGLDTGQGTGLGGLQAGGQFGQHAGEPVGGR
nr:hypothetical protein GCM10020093_021330 [Planobispora longispora]